MSLRIAALAPSTLRHVVTKPAATCVLRTYATSSPDATSVPDVTSIPPSTTRSARTHPPRRTFLYTKYQATLDSNRLVLILQHNNLTVSELVHVRQELSRLSSSPILTVIRSGIFTALIRNSPYENLIPLVLGPTCLITTDSPEATALAEIVPVLAKHRKLMLLGGKVDGALINVEDVKRIMALPPLESIRAEVLGVLEGQTRQVIGVLGKRPQELVLALEQHEGNLRGRGEEALGEH
ncbi:hypothetical protein BC936DRAFT_149386 [Jimgerdemannia flammicorona]|uniref:Ribosomal protein L10-domain-containing protein n=1 Tax=Jimgerdemannia flammicorona TaxID=994334 RepID=A0A433D0X3_9FUNG|nr:hypothetical protein BC936DRAFT_149386 [Jimgerdemannia flammicorona]